MTAQTGVGYVPSGVILQFKYLRISGGIRAVATVAQTDVIPTTSNGFFLGSIDITPTSSSSVFFVTASAFGKMNGLDGAGIFLLFRDANANAIGISAQYGVSGTYTQSVLMQEVAAGSAVPTTFSLYAASLDVGWDINSSGTSQQMGTSCSCLFWVWEMAS